MLRASLVFFALGILAMLLGAYNLAGISFETGRIALFICLGVAVLSFVTSLMANRRTQT